MTWRSSEGARQKEIDLPWRVTTKETMGSEEKQETARASGKGTVMIAFRFRRFGVGISSLLFLSSVFVSAENVFAHKDFLHHDNLALVQCECSTIIECKKNPASSTICKSEMQIES